MPLTWPLGHIGTAVSKPEEDQDVPKPSATPYLTLVRQPLDIFFLDKLSVKKKGRPPHFHGRSNTILGTCLPLHLPSAPTIRTGWKSNSTIVEFGLDLDSGLPRLWPRKRLQHGLDAFDRRAKPDCNLDHLWILGLVSVLLPTPGELSFSPHLYVHDHNFPHDILSPNDFLFVFCV